MTAPWRDPKRDEEVLKATPTEWTSATDIAASVGRCEVAIRYRLRKLTRLGALEMKDTADGLRLKTTLYRRRP